MEEDVAKSLYQVEPGKYRQYPLQDCNSNPSAYDTNVLENASTENLMIVYGHGNCPVSRLF